MGLSRRAFFAGGSAIAAVGTSGCLSGVQSGSNNRTRDATTLRPNSTTTTQRTTESVRVTDAKSRALSTEEEHIDSVMRNASCVESWDTAEVTAEKEARVVDETAEAVYVAVSHPHAYGRADQTEADSISNATYRVTDDDIQRVEYERELNPC